MGEPSFDNAIDVGLLATPLRILGETRCADQVIRLKAPPGADPREIPLDATYHHEWAHYVQYSATPIGILLSSFRRACVKALSNALVKSPIEFAANREDLSESDGTDYWGRLDRLNRNWDAWRPDWYVIERRSVREVTSAHLDPRGLLVNLAGLDGQFWLPVGPKQIFEAWAWLVEQMHLVAVEQADRRFMIPRGADSLIYTWPIWAYASQHDLPIESIDIATAFQFLPPLFVSCFYDSRILDLEGRGISDSFQACVAILKDRRVSCGRLFWQMLHDHHRFDRSVPISRSMDQYLTGLGIPSLSTMLESTGLLLERMIIVHEENAQQASDYARERGGVANLLHDMVERELLDTSVRNLAVIAKNLERALSMPLALRDHTEAAVCAIEMEDHFAWVIVHLGQPFAGERKVVADNRVRLRQQLAIFEHVLFQFADGKHVGCYGSPEWRIPINACPSAVACMDLKDKHGLGFCVDADWRRKVASILSPVFAHSDTPLTDKEVPGITAAIDELWQWIRTEEAANSVIDLPILGIPLPRS
ncbi:MAG: hypothetical protein ACRDZR_00170 [Acidimicrobiales bacterium]